MMELTPEKLNNLKELAQKATLGPWVISQQDINLVQISEIQAGDICNVALAIKTKTEAAANYIAAASPDVVLAMIEKIEQLEEDFEAAARSASDESVKAVRLDEEADWLAKKLIRACPNALDCKGCEVRIHCPKLDFQDWRKAAREAVEKENESHKSPD